MNDKQETEISMNEENIELSDFQKQQVKKLATKHYNKNRKEIDRLTSHARDCLITNNEAGYKYAVEKLRVLCQQKPLDVDTLHSMWITSKQQTDSIIEEALAKESEVVYSVPRSTGKTTPVCHV